MARLRQSNKVAQLTDAWHVLHGFTFNRFFLSLISVQLSLLQQTGDYI
jgi:hypothetical protein